MSHQKEREEESNSKIIYRWVCFFFSKQNRKNQVSRGIVVFPFKLPTTSKTLIYLWLKCYNQNKLFWFLYEPIDIYFMSSILPRNLSNDCHNVWRDDGITYMYLTGLQHFLCSWLIFFILSHDSTNIVLCGDVMSEMCKERKSSYEKVIYHLCKVEIKLMCLIAVMVQGQVRANVSLAGSIFL